MANILGISSFYHDSAAALLSDGRIVAAAQEERFTRKKADPRFPTHAVNYCLEEAGLHVDDLDHIVYYDNIVLSFDRLIDTFLGVAPKGAEMWKDHVPKFVSQKFNIFEIIERELGWTREIECCEHHLSHAASAFYPSPFPRAAVMTIDGVGEWATASYGVGNGSELEILADMRYPDSLGMLYSAFTYFTGFKVNSGEYKLMGLAPYGRPRYVDTILDNVVGLHDDGSITLNLDRFGFLDSGEMTNERFSELFDGPPRQAESRITNREMDIAASIQRVTEMAVINMARHVRRETGERNLCMAGGVALNCVANGKLLRENIFDDIWIQPAAGDAGGALGCALAYHYLERGGVRTPDDNPSDQHGSYWGPSFGDDEIRTFLDEHEYPYEVHSGDDRGPALAALLDEGKIIGHFAGRMEFGPRSLGARSILGDARSQQMQRSLNLKIKYRESFRPFAPAILEEHVSDYFEMDRPSPYMLMVAPVKESHRLPVEPPENREMDDLLTWINELRSDVPAITHVDYSARIQTVNEDHHPKFHQLIKSFAERTGSPVVVNTSFNVRGEPIVCTPVDAYRCFMRTEMDVLVLEDFILHKDQQPTWEEENDWREEFALD
ncbi:MAG: carbamoyltransferase [Deltaproteobacteria bacterium]|nr:carbamoyltransferase [Deltaproteobacteria bacterium]